MKQNTRRARKIDAVAARMLDEISTLRGLRMWRNHAAWMDYWERLIWRFIRREENRSRDVIELDEDTRVAIDEALQAEAFGGYRTKARDSYGYRREFVLLAIQAACEAVVEANNIHRVYGKMSPFDTYRLGLVRKNQEQIEAENLMTDSQARRYSSSTKFLKHFEQQGAA